MRPLRQSRLWAAVALVGLWAAVAYFEREAPRPRPLPDGRHHLALHQHYVGDLTAALADFIPPTIDLVSGDTVEPEGFFSGEGEEPIQPFGTIDDLVELIQSAVGERGTWDTPNSSISASGQTAIIVKHTPEVHEAVAKFLDDLRTFTGAPAGPSPVDDLISHIDDWLRPAGWSSPSSAPPLR